MIDLLGFLIVFGILATLIRLLVAAGPLQITAFVVLGIFAVYLGEGRFTNLINSSPLSQLTGQQAAPSMAYTTAPAGTSAAGIGGPTYGDPNYGGPLYDGSSSGSNNGNYYDGYGGYYGDYGSGGYYDNYPSYDPNYPYGQYGGYRPPTPYSRPTLTGRGVRALW